MKKCLAIILALSSFLCFQLAFYVNSTTNFDNQIIYSEKLENKNTSDQVAVDQTSETKVSENITEDVSLSKEPTKNETKKVTKKETKTTTKKEEPKKTTKIEETTKKEESTKKEETKEPVKIEEVKQEETQKEEPVKLTEKETIALKNDKLGTIGRLYLPSIDFDVAVYEANAYRGEGYNAQKIVDDKDSAAHFYLGDKAIIADHNYQGFKKIMNLKIGDKAYIKKTDGTIETYQIKESYVGKNTGTDIVNPEGISIVDTEQDLIMYTCFNNNGGITITRWDIVIE